MLYILGRNTILTGWRKCITSIPKYKNQYFIKIRKMSSNKASRDIVWMDLEMTGLNVNSDRILEISCLITDENLNVKSTGPCLVIKHSRETLDNMNEWCIQHHKASGLIDEVINSQITHEEAESSLLKYLQENIPERTCPLAGNSIYMDRAFLRQWMPTVDEYLHYRIIDISSIKELCRRWNPDVLKSAPSKKLSHRSLDDILESIEELKYYRKHFFNKISN